MNSIPNSTVKTDIVVFFLLGDSPASEFSTPGITQKKEYNIQNTAKFEIMKTDVLFVRFWLLIPSFLTFVHCFFLPSEDTFLFVTHTTYVGETRFVV